MEGRRRRAVSSPIGRVDLGEARETLSVDDPTAAPHPQQSQIPAHLANNPNINIGTEEPSLAESELRIRQAREATKRQPAPREAVNRMEVLVGIGRLTEKVVIDNVTFSLRSLKNKENRQVMSFSSKETTQIDELLTIKNATLAFALFEIDGQPLQYFAGDNSLESRLDLIEELDSTLVNKLWDKYSKMLGDYQKTINDDLGNTPEEISDNLKK